MEKILQIRASYDDLLLITDSASACDLKLYFSQPTMAFILATYLYCIQRQIDLFTNVCWFSGFSHFSATYGKL